MENHKGKSEINPSSDDDEVMKIDLTLKLGLSVYDKQNQEEEKDAGSKGAHDFSSMDGQSSNDKGNYSMQSGQGNWNVEFNSSSSAYWKNEVGSTNFLLYQGSFPQNIATPNRKRPNVDDGKVCKSCGADNTPLWRKGPEGPQTLCNACGLRHLRTIKRGGE